MAVDNDFLEFLQQPRCKTAIMLMTMGTFTGVVITECLGQPSQYLQTLGISCFTFWAGRASKVNKEV